MALHKGEGWAVGNLDDLGDGPGFRKIRRELDVTEMGVNAIVLPAGVETDFHLHERQEEVYFVHRGAIEIEFGDGDEAPAGRRAGSPAWPRRRPAWITTVGDEDAVYVIVRRRGRLRGARRPAVADAD